MKNNSMSIVSNCFKMNTVLLCRNIYLVAIRSTTKTSSSLLCNRNYHQFPVRYGYIRTLHKDASMKDLKNCKTPKNIHDLFIRNNYQRFFSSSPINLKNESNKNDLVESRNEENTAVSTSVVESIKETTKTAASTVVVIIVVLISITIFYALYNELLSSKGPTRVFSKATSYVTNNEQVQNVMGDQIKSFNEPTGRNRRQRITSFAYHKDGRNYLRMRFYIKGNRGHGTVNLEMADNDEGKFEYRYLYVVVDSDPSFNKRTIILEDNRNKFMNNSLNVTTYGNADLPELDLSD